jgi:hypothetical protein
MFSGLLSAAPPQRRPSIAWRLRRTEELTAGNFPAFSQNVAMTARDEPAR